MRRRATLEAGFVAWFAAAAAAGCSLWLGLDPLAYDPPAPTDVDAAADDAAGPATEATDADADADTDASTVPPGPPFDDPTRWTTYAGLGNEWFASTFDGRYVYFVRASSSAGSRVARYDTQQENAFDQPASWTTFDPALVAPDIGTTFVLSFDGRYVLLVNSQSRDGGRPDGTVIRYDTTSALPFDAVDAWEQFDTKSVASAAGRFVAGASYADASFFGGNSASRPFFRHEATSDPLDAGWQSYAPTFDASACDRIAFGAACAGDYVYFAPGNGSFGDAVVRYAVKQSFTDPASWDCFSLEALDPDDTGMQGAASDGTFVYLTKIGKGLGDAAAPARVVRHPVSAALDAGWETRIVTKTNPLASKYFGGTFDGRYVYFAPHPDNGTTVYLRYDTLEAFDDDAAWSAVSSAQLFILDATHAGAVFDGKYVYFAPRTGRAVRYRARDDRAYVSSCSPF